MSQLSSAIRLLARSGLAIAVPILGAVAQGGIPTGAMIVAKAQAAHVETRRASKATVSNRTATFTPVAEADLPPDPKGLESGVVVGVLAIAGAGGTVAPGQYDVYVSRTKAGWETFLERGGVIGATSRSVTVTSYPIEHGIPKPVLTAAGFEVGGRGWKVSTALAW